MPSDFAHLRYLIDAAVDGRASESDVRELERLALGDPEVLREYVDALNLHTSMQWDFGNVRVDAPRQTATDPLVSRRRPPLSPASSIVGALSAAALMLLVGVVVSMRTDDGNVIADQPAPVSTETDLPAGSGVLVVDGDIRPVDPKSTDELIEVPFVLDGSPIPRGVEATPVNPGGDATTIVASAPASKTSSTSSTELVSFIDSRLDERWSDEGVAPSPRAEPAVWLRRASLDLKGRIPTRGEIAEFLARPESTRRDQFVADAIASGEYAKHFGTVWSNLLIGRSAERAEYRDRLQGYLTKSFAENRSWGDVVGDLVSAEGTEEHAPTNFLLAHMNNEAVPATAITARVLLGQQVQCTQCHAHPFNDWKQDEFWQLNAFFQQCRIERRPDGSGRPVRMLVDREVGGPTFFEDRRGIMKVAYPIYEGQRVNEQPTVRRREALARLLVQGEKTDLAVAMVNRVWAHFMGEGFTLEIDDIGPHASVSHPELLDRLAREFVASGYDVKQLVSWITRSAPYQLAGEWTDENAIDRPEVGEPALFSRMYEKSLSPEQLYDSLVTAAAGPRQNIPGLPSRGNWVADFYAAQDNEENTEMSTFDASPSVALELMNGSLLARLVQSPKSAALRDVLTMKATEDERLNAVSQLVLGRDASVAEKKTLRKVLRPTIAAYSRELPKEQAVREGYRDLFWAYVNSSEFIVNR